MALLGLCLIFNFIKLKLSDINLSIILYAEEIVFNKDFSRKALSPGPVPDP